jgi:hypothetical protein
MSSVFQLLVPEAKIIVEAVGAATGEELSSWEFPATATVYHVKEKIIAELGAEGINIRLVHEDNEVMEGRTLDSLVTTGETVVLHYVKEVACSKDTIRQTRNLSPGMDSFIRTVNVFTFLVSPFLNSLSLSRSN